MGSHETYHQWTHKKTIRWLPCSGLYKTPSSAFWTLVYSAPTQVHAIWASSLEVFSTSCIPANIFFIADTHSPYIFCKLIQNLSSYGAQITVIRKFYTKVRYAHFKFLLVNKNISSLLSWWIFLHAVEGPEHPLGGAGGLILNSS